MPPKIKIDTLIVSDVHLGSLVARADKLNEFLRNNEFKRLIILGDLFDDINFNRLNRNSWELLSHIRDLSSVKIGCEVVWVRGNHDKKLMDLMSRLVGTIVYDEYIWEFQGKRFLAVHGDRFDKFFIRKTPIINKLARLLFLSLQNFDKNAKHIVKFLERSHTSWLRISSKVANGAVKYAGVVEADFVFCGHTHEAMEKVFPNGNGDKKIFYFNTGSWVRSPSTYVTIDETGKVALEKYK